MVQVKLLERVVKDKLPEQALPVGLFEGGQTPLYRRLPKLVKLPHKIDAGREISIDVLEHLVTSGKPNTITLDTLKTHRMLKTSQN